MTTRGDGFDAHMRSGIDLGGDHFAHREFRTPDGSIIGLPVHLEPEAGWVFIGLQEHHLKPDGSWCGGWIGFANVTDPGRDGAIEPYRRDGVKHHLDSEAPLTVSPSLACRTCPSHGWIRDGRWVDA